MQIDNIDLTWLGHSSFVVKGNGKVIYIDPFNISGDRETADIILITHPHHDHCSIEDISKIAKDGTIVVGPADIQSKITRLEKEVHLKTIDVGETLDLGEGIVVGGVPAYNLEKQFHPKDERWLGYLIKVNGNNVYHAGDTDSIPEMTNLDGKVKIALLPVGGNYTMDAKEVSEAAEVIKPEVAIPIHYGSEVAGTISDAEEFAKLCVEKGIKAEILEKE